MITGLLLYHRRENVADGFLKRAVSMKRLAALLVAGFLFQGMMPGQTVSIQVRPWEAVLSLGQTEAFMATVTGTSNTAVTWTVSPAIGSISSTGIYTAPTVLTGSQTVTVKATSVANPSISATASVTINPNISIALMPAAVTMTALQTLTFTASISNTSNTAVTWSISPAVGSISNSGVYTAPALIGSPQTVTVTVTSVAAPSLSATATVSLIPSGLVGYWPFDETSGSIAHDASGFANNGTLLCNGNCALPSWTSGIRHGALDFSSNNQSVSVPDNASLDFSGQFTISFWLYKTAGASNLYYFNKGSSSGHRHCLSGIGNARRHLQWRRAGRPLRDRRRGGPDLAAFRHYIQ